MAAKSHDKLFTNANHDKCTILLTRGGSLDCHSLRFENEYFMNISRMRS